MKIKDDKFELISEWSFDQIKRTTYIECDDVNYKRIGNKHIYNWKVSGWRLSRSGWPKKSIYVYINDRILENKLEIEFQKIQQRKLRKDKLDKLNENII